MDDHDDRTLRLIDGAAARRLADLVRWTDQNDAYPYQRALTGRSGPWVEADGRRLLMLSAYDYLGLIGHPEIDAAAMEALQRYGTGTGGVRLLTGTAALHQELDASIASFYGVERATTFSSGYLANLAAITTLFGPEDEVLADTLAHRSILDACRMAHVRLRRFRHNDLGALETMLAEGVRRGRGRTLVVVEGVYSMDGDTPPLREMLALKDRYGAFMMVDEAHALGTLGVQGRGSAEHHGIAPEQVDLWTGALSKAVPSNGGFVAGRTALIRHLQHASAPFIFSSAVTPAAAGAALAALRVILAEPVRVARLRRRAAMLRDGLAARGFDVGASTTAIIPVRLGNDLDALATARRLYDRGLFVTPVISPAVAPDQARLRLCATAAHDRDDINTALAAFDGLKRVGIEAHGR